MNTLHRYASTMAVVIAAALLLAAFPASARSQGAGAPDIPADAVRVCADCEETNLVTAVAAAQDGDTLVVEGGTYPGPLEITASIELIGLDDPVIDGGGKDSIVTITAPEVLFQGFTIRNSGNSFDREDSGIYLDSADGSRIIGNRLENTLFGVNVAQSHGMEIADNVVIGRDVEMGVRGDGIKVWYSHDSRITGNLVQRSRDLLVWYSNNVVVSDNVVEDGRYGFHFMNSDDGIAEHNTLIDNSVGIYLMYGKSFTIKDNLLQGSRGPSGHGLGLKEIDGVDVEGNVIYDNRIGVYIDNSPLSPDVYGTFRHNLIAYNDAGLGLLPSSRNNVFTENSLVDNLEQVTVLGGGPIGANEWSVDGVGNFWSDYAGYDADGDGIGDVPFRNEQFSEQLMSSWPILQLFRFSAAETAVDFGARAVPMFHQDPIFEDTAPLVSPVLPTNAAMPEAEDTRGRAIGIALAMLAAVGGVVWWGFGQARAARRLQSHRPAGMAVSPLAR